jgi:hypothetical protein
MNSPFHFYYSNLHSTQLRAKDSEVFLKSQGNIPSILEGTEAFTLQFTFLLHYDYMLTEIISITLEFLKQILLYKYIFYNN